MCCTYLAVLVPPSPRPNADGAAATSVHSAGIWYIVGRNKAEHETDVDGLVHRLKESTCIMLQSAPSLLEVAIAGELVDQGFYFDGCGAHA